MKSSQLESSSSSSSSSTPVANKKSKRNIRNIRDNKISTDKRTGCDLRDAYYHHSKYLLKKAAELESITGCIVHLQITPTWEKSVKKKLPHEGPQN